MVSLQIISKVINTNDLSIIQDNLLNTEYFTGYENEFEFIMDHYKKYNTVPDKATFLERFTEFEFVEVNESDAYLIEKIREEYLYKQAVPIINESAKLMQTDSNKAVEYLIGSLKTLSPNYDLNGVDIIHNTDERLNEFLYRRENKDSWYFTTGFPELDEEIHGFQRGEELVVLFARVNQGKSWVAENMLTHIWKLGFNVGYISPEMSANSIGFRFDTLLKNYSNKDLITANETFDLEQYKHYLEELKTNEHSFVVSTPLDFDNKITVAKIKKWVLKYKLDAIVIDGIKYLSDERYKRGDNTTTSLTNISEDLMTLSMELKIPVIVVVQANRNGMQEGNKEDTPELETIRDSDGISHNASKVISVHQGKDGIFRLGVKKNRFGKVGAMLTYKWDIDKGIFDYYPLDQEQPPKQYDIEKKKEIEKKVANDNEYMF